MIKPFEKPIYVTRPLLPPLDEFRQGLEEIWANRWLTNNGPVLQRFTHELNNLFETDNLCLFNNGTLALQIALQGMGILRRGHHDALYLCGDNPRWPPTMRPRSLKRAPHNFIAWLAVRWMQSVRPAWA